MYFELLPFEMKENILEIVNSFGNQLLKRSVTQNMPQVMPLNRYDDFFNKLSIGWIPHYAKGFYLNSRQVTILKEPGVFYNLLLEKIKTAKNRIVLASLYLGTGELERNLVSALNQRLFEKSDLVVKVLLDCIRGSRGANNSRKILLPLLKNHEQSCQVSLYQTPVLREPYLSILPERYKELAGLQHLKVYLFDNDIVISGANLSTDYFTNRQDRYMLIEDSRELADFIDGMVQKVSEFSFQLDSKNDLHLHPKWEHHPVKSNISCFMEEARSRLVTYYENFPVTRKDDFDTVIFPLIEMGHFKINMDSSITTRIWEELGDKMIVYLTTGYFNLTNSYIDCIINRSQAKFEILMAHPTANGFYNAKGPAKGIPFGYTHLASHFLNNTTNSRQNDRINMYEFVRDGWTYHAKGLWLSNADDGLPFISMIGSPNFGERSMKRDLECQFLIATDDEALQRKLLDEKNSLYQYSSVFNEAVEQERSKLTPLWVKLVVRFFRSFF